jgi:hypothetical protein
MARAPVSKTGGWGFEPLHSCQPAKAPASPVKASCQPRLPLGNGRFFR